MAVVFTDVVDSSALKMRVGHDAYAGLVARHDEFVRAALARAGTGTTPQDTGDGYFVAFDSAAEAVNAALHFQRLMRNEQWEVAFASRVGIHLGEVDQSVNAVTGLNRAMSPAIDRASRTMSLAGPGQILTTRAVHDAVCAVIRHHPDQQGNLEEVEWANHGWYRFKGADEPVEIFEIAMRGQLSRNRPVDSEKARRVATPKQPRRRWTMAMSALIAAAAVISSIAIVGGFSKGNDPMAELRRQQVSREVADFKVPSTNYLHTDPPDTTVVSKVKTSSNAAFSVLSDERIIDLRNWKKVPDDRLGEFYSPITSTRRLRVRRLSPCDTFEIEGRTSGLNLFFNSLDRLPFKVEVQKEQSFVGSERMNVKKMIVDVSSQPSDDEFSFRAQMTYWNNIQNESEQWFGVIGYEKSLLVSLLILFPPDHPMKDFTLNIAPTMNDVAVPFIGHRIVLTGPKNDWVYWEVPQPEPGHVYRLAWKW